jgi:hypothetical protein
MERFRTSVLCAHQSGTANRNLRKPVGVVAIEKVFAIQGSANDVYAALQRDLASASSHEGETFAVIKRDRDRSIELHVKMGGVPCYLTYLIDEKPEHTEVTARCEPHGWQWVMFQVATLGMRRSALEMALVQGLVNLKAEVEGEADATLEVEEIVIDE